MSRAWPNVRASCHQPKGVPHRGEPLRKLPLSFPRELSGFKTFQELSLEHQRGGILPACCRGGSVSKGTPAPIPQLRDPTWEPLVARASERDA